MKSNKFLISVFISGLALTLLGLIFIRVEITSEAFGVIQHKVETIIYASHSSQVAEVHFYPGQRVKKNDVILTLRNPDLEQQLLNLEKILIEHKAELKKANLDKQQAAITGVMPKLQNIDDIISRQHELTQLAELIEENNRKSLDQDLISRKEFYQERMDRLREEISLIENEQLKNWKSQGIESVLMQEKEQKIEKLQSLVLLLEKQVKNLRDEKEKLSIKSPFNGIIIDFYFRHLSQYIDQGEKIVKVADDSSGYQARAYIPEKNIDLIKSNMPVRMESMVFHSQLEGYLYGNIETIINPRDITNPSDTESSYFETIVNITDYPYPPVHGSRVDMEIIIGKGNILSALISRPSRKQGATKTP